MLMSKELYSSVMYEINVSEISSRLCGAVVLVAIPALARYLDSVLVLSKGIVVRQFPPASHLS